MALTPVYSIPYQTVADPPDGPNLGEDLALQVEATIAALNTRVLAAEAAWVDYSASFVLAATVINPTKGSTNYTATHHKVGHTVNYDWFVDINTGGGFNPGSGDWKIPLPFAAVAGCKAVGTCYIKDQGTAYLVGATAILSGTTHLFLIPQNSTGGLLGSAGPGTAWTTGDQLGGSITYQSAA